MISDSYTIGQLQTNHKNRMKPILVFGNKVTDIEGWQEALSSEEMYVPHHRLENEYTMKELQEMGRYDIVPPEELIWLPQSFHNGNLELHKGLRECKRGSAIGVKKVWKSSTVEKYFYARYEKLVEKLNNSREKRLTNVRFELTLNRTDICKERKRQLIKAIPLRYERKKEKERNAVKIAQYRTDFKLFKKLLHWQDRLIPYHKAWLRLEVKLQSLIEKL
jgi:hypothetical protein